jgi:chromosome segregation protein
MLAQTESAKKQESVAAALPPLREDEARAAAALQRLVIARETLDREEERARERLAELGRRLVQLNEDIAREKQLATDAEWALNRLAAEQDALTGDLQAGADKRGAMEERVAQADAVLAGSEKVFAERTGALADLTARRNQLESGAREQDERLAKFEREIAEVEAELAQLNADNSARHDIAQLKSAADLAQNAVTEGRSLRRCGPKPRIPRRARRSTSPAVRSPTPSGAPTGSKPKPGRWRRSCMSTRRISGPRSSTT